MEFLLSTVISCADGRWILDGIASAEISARVRADLVTEVLRAMPDDCRVSDYKGRPTRRRTDRT